MSQNRSVSDFLDQHGNFDISAVHAIRNQQTQIKIGVSPDECREIRRRLFAGETCRDIALDMEYVKTTIRNHGVGDCHHELDERPVVWDKSAREWRR